MTLNHIGGVYLEKKWNIPLARGSHSTTEGAKKVSGIYGEVVFMGGIYRREMSEKNLNFSCCIYI